MGGYLFCFGFLGLAIFRYVYKINKAIEIIYISLLSITIFITGERNAVLSTMLFLFILFLINKNLRHTTILSILIIFMTCFFILKNSEILKHRYSFGSLPTMSEINMNENEIDIEKNNKNKKSIYEKIEKRIKIINDSTGLCIIEVE